MTQPSTPSEKSIWKQIGPGLLFAATAIGTSHLVLSTRAGAHHGMIFFWIILGTLVLKYPFFEFGPRYASATGHSLIKAYKDQGKWAVGIVMIVVFLNMFAVVAGVGAVTAGLLKTILGLGLSMPLLLALILSITTSVLLLGGYQILDNLIKLISVVLLVTVLTAFLAVIFKGRVEPIENFQPTSILEGAGLAVLIGLAGWMPAGFEASIMNSIWLVEKERTNSYGLHLKSALFDFNLGYGFTVLVALMFLTIGAFTVYGSGQLLEGNATQFSGKLLNVFTKNIGNWAYPVLAIAAFGTIYGTLITIMDAFTRIFIRGLRAFRFDVLENTPKQQHFLKVSYRTLLVLLASGSFAIFYFAAASMIKMLDWATILSFLTAPVIAFLNLRAIQSNAIPKSHRPSQFMLILAYLGLVAMVGFSGYYLFDLIR